MELKLYDPHDNQREIHRSNVKNRVVVAGRRFGKSALGLNEAISRAFQKKNQIIWIILPLLKQAKEIYWIDPDVTRYFMPYVQYGLIKLDNSELSMHVLQTNSWIRLKGSDNYEGLRGSGIDLIIWDEVADVKEQAFETIKPSLADSPDHRVLYIGTPKGINWFHDFALKGDHKGIIPKFGKVTSPRKEWQTWHFTSYDNLAWPEGSKERTKFVEFIDAEKQEYIEKGREMFFNQEYLAKFDQTIGQFFKEFNHAAHVCTPFVPKKGLTLVGGMDWGRTAPFAFELSAIESHKDEDGLLFNRVWTFLEVFGTDKTPAEWAKEIKKALSFYDLTPDDIESIQGDPAMFTKGNDGSVSIADQFKQNGIRIKPGSNDRVGGWTVMHSWLSIAPDGLPYWIITKNCKNLINDIPEATYDERKVEDIDTTGSDHTLDAARYKLKSLKWIDAKSGAITHPTKQRVRRSAQMIDDKQLSINTDKFAIDKIIKTR